MRLNFISHFTPSRLFPRKLGLFIGAATLAVASAGCHRNSADSSSIDGLAVSCFGVTVDSNVIHLLLGQEQLDHQPLNLSYARSDTAGAEWTPAIPIPTKHAPPGRHQRGNDPQIAASGDQVIAVWTAQGGGPFGSGHIATAVSEDGGQTWRAGPTPAVTSRVEQTGYRFPAVAAGHDSFHLIWIHAVEEERSLRYARLPFGNETWSQPIVIDPTSCACCWNRLMVASDGSLFALYRNEDPRDLTLVRSEDNGRNWSQLGAVGGFAWQFNGCPHVGGGLVQAMDATASPSTLWATVWTGQADHLGAYVFRTDDEGSSWGRAAILGSDARNTDLAAVSNDRIAAAWDETTEDGSFVRLALTHDGGKSWEDHRLLSAASQHSSHPRLLACQGKFVVLWSEHSKETRLRIVAVQPAK